MKKSLHSGGGEHTMESDEKYIRAKRKVKNLKQFYQHLVIYLLINALLFAINLFTFKDFWWFVFPLLGWGIGVAIQGLSVYNDRPSSSNWEDKKIKDYMERDDQ